MAMYLIEVSENAQNCDICFIGNFVFPHICNYRPRGKTMFSETCVILFTGGVGFPACITSHMTSIQGGGFPAYTIGHMTRGSASRGKWVCIQGEGVYIQRKEGLYTGGFEQITMVVTVSMHPTGMHSCFLLYLHHMMLVNGQFQASLN